jgi:hypothetical protein
MLPELHEVLKELIYVKGRIDRAEVDVSFEVPDKEWADKLVRPTINLYLFELQENLDLRQAQFQSTRTNGHTQVRAAPRRIDLRYIVTAMTSDTDDAYRLLWHILGVLIRTPELGPELFAADTVLDAPIVTRVAQADSGIKLLDVWSALSAEPKAAFCYVVTLPIDLQMQFEHPFVLSRAFTFRDRVRGNAVVDSPSYIHGLVRDPAGAPLEHVLVSTLDEPRTAAETDEHGAFILRAASSGKLRLRLSDDRGHVRTAVLDVNTPNAFFNLVLK